MKIVIGNSNIELGEKILKLLKVKKVEATIASFPDGECRIEINENFSWQDTVFVIQSLSSAHFIIELLLIIDSLKRLGVRNIIPVVPYCGYLRQDRKVHKGTPISAKVIANLLESTGIRELIILDVHFLQFEGLLNIPVHYLSAITLFEEYIVEHTLLKEAVLVAPDLGSLKMVKRIADSLTMPIVVMNKERTTDHIKITEIIGQGDVKGKNCLIFDDIISGGNTICNAATILKQWQSRSVYVFVTHGVFASQWDDQVIHKIKNSPIEQLIVTDSIACSVIHKEKEIVVISTAEILATKILEVYSQNV